MSRRRNYSNESSDDEDSYHARKKRRHLDNNDIEERLESLITRVCEKSTSSLESNLEGLTTVLEADMANYKSKILKILLECVVSMPENMTVYTTLVGLLNAKNYNAGGEFVEQLVRQLKESLKSGQYDVARLQMRFLSDLVNCRVVTDSSLLILYRTFIDVTKETDIPQVRSDWYVYAVLSCLPWVALELFQKKPQDFEVLLTSIDSYIQKRQKIHVPVLRVWSANESPAQEEYLDCLWSQIKSLKASKWRETDIVRPYSAFDGLLCDALQHSIPPVILLCHNEDANYPLPHVNFAMFDHQDMPSDVPPLPGRHTLERYLVEEYLHRTMHTFYRERKECAEALLAMPVKGKFPLNYMIVEIVFAQLFQLPTPPYLELFYGSLLIELCKLQPSSMPQVLAQATEILFDKLNTMNTSCIERFSNWFSYHLSNFQFKWSWEDWSECLEMDIEQPKPKFVRETLLKCLRLSYQMRIIETTPATFEKLVPLKPEVNFKYEKEGSGSLPGTIVAHKLMQDIRAKCSCEEALADLEDLPKPMEDDSAADAFNPQKIDVFVQTLLFLGAKSFSHSFAAISKFHPVLKSLGESRDPRVAEQAQVCMLNSIHELWSTHQQMMVVLIDKLLKTQVIQCASVAAWIFCPEMSSELTSWYVWEILHSTIKKMNRQVTKLQKDIEDMKMKLREYERKKKDDYELLSDVPSEEAIDREEDRLEEVQSAQKNLYLIIFQRFIMILSDHLSQCEATGTDFNTPWYKWILERLQQVFLVHHEQVYKYVNTLESLMFTSVVDLHILEVFQQFCALKS